MNKEINIDEKVIWEGCPSQWVNIRTYVYCIILTTLIIIVLFITPKLQWLFAMCLLYPVMRALLAWYEVRSINYKVTDIRILHRSGVFNRITTETKLSDIKEIVLVEPWYKRIVGLGDVSLNIKGFAESCITISGIRKANEVKELINKMLNIKI
jgi:uncharacterized membrane protein YdbT with pleckstrin-like domain